MTTQSRVTTTLTGVYAMLARHEEVLRRMKERIDEIRRETSSRSRKKEATPRSARGGHGAAVGRGGAGTGACAGVPTGGNGTPRSSGAP